MFKISRKIIISGVIGNALEMYDYVIWGIFSVYLTKEFFPQGSHLSDVFFLFLLTYFIRPIGSLVFGIFSDQLGRKKILIPSILVMGISTTLIGFLPSYNNIGIASVLIILFIRLLQVLAVGGEYIGSVSLLIESCEKNRKGFYGSWAGFGTTLGTLLASSVGYSIAKLIDAGLIPDWSWRLAFIFSAITIVIGFWIRKSIPESFDFIMENSNQESKSFIELFNITFATIKKKYFYSLLVFSIVWFGVTCTILIFVYTPIHISTINNIQPKDSFLISTINASVMLIFIPLFGFISDYYDRDKILLLTIITILAAIFPYYSYLTHGSFNQVLFCNILIAIPCAFISAILPVFITEIFPLYIRCSITNIIYASATCFGGGLILTPWLVLRLTNYIKPEYAPTLIFFVPGIFSIFTLVIYSRRKLLKETYLKIVTSN